MKFCKVGFAAMAFGALVGFGGNAATAAPFSPARGLMGQSDIVQVQFHDRGRHYRPPRRICRTEIVERRVRGRIVKERVQRCRMVRR
jgi:hypothetical protein